MPPPAPSRSEYVTIDAFPIPCLAVESPSLLQLWRTADKRGSNVVIPHRDGSKDRPRRKTYSRRLVKVTIFGFFDMDDVASTAVRDTLEANIDYFQANVVDPPAVGNTRTAVLHKPSGATRTGLLIVEDWDMAELGPTSVTGVLDLGLKDGELA